MIDYTQELKTLEAYQPAEGNTYWSPGPGQYTVTSQGEIEDAKPFEDDPEQKPRVKIDIKINDETYIWSMAKGKTPASTYGQLCKLAATRNNQLKNETFTVIVTGLDRNRRFTIVV